LLTYAPIARADIRKTWTPKAAPAAAAAEYTERVLQQQEPPPQPQQQQQQHVAQEQQYAPPPAARLPSAQYAAAEPGGGDAGALGGGKLQHQVLAMEATIARMEESFSFAVECMQSDMLQVRKQLHGLKLLTESA